MKKMAISEFKAQALHVSGEVARTKVSVVVTKRGKPIAEVVPYRDTREKPVAGLLSGTIVHEGDIVSPLGEDDWNACA